ncbi:MAG: protein kinase [Acidobacteriota bacterium]
MWDPLRTINGRYDLLHQLGEGGMGRVWLAYDRKTGKHVALKILGKGTGSSSPGTVLADLRREYGMLRALQKRGTALFVEVYEFGWGRRDNGERFVFYTMEYVRGAHIGHYTWANEDELVYLLRLLTIVLAQLEEAGIVHGDFKPPNILVVRTFEPRALGEETDWRANRPWPKVVDFGLGQEWMRMEEMARDPGKALEGRIGRSLRWMPPELLAAQDAGNKPVLTERADVYSMGMVWYELAAGKPAFPHAAESEILAAKRDPGYRLPLVEHVSPRLNELLRWMASPEPEARPRPLEIEAALREVSPRVTVDTTRSGLGTALRRIAYVEPQRAYEVARQIRESLAAPGPRVFVLDGPAGLGKRRLVAELRSALGRETQDAIGEAATRLVRMQVVELSGAQRPLDHLGPCLAQLLDGPAGQEFLVENSEVASGPLSARLLARQAQRFLEAFIARRGEGVVVAVEEIQELDRDVRALLLDLAERLSRQPIVLVLVGELGTGTEELRADLRDHPRIVLDPLDEHGTELFLSRQLGGKRPTQELVDHVHQRTGGLPGRIEEELHALHSDGLFEQREDGCVGLKRLPAASSGYLGLASRLHRDEKRVLGLLASMPRMAIEVGEAASALRLDVNVVAGALRRMHGMGLAAQSEETSYVMDDIHLARTILEQAISTKARLGLERAAASLCSRWAEQRPATASEMRLREARHLLAAGDIESGASAALRAAAERQSLRYFGQALDLYTQVIASMERHGAGRPGGNDLLFQALMQVAPLYKRFEKAERAMAAAQQAIDLARIGLTTTHIARGLLELARACDGSSKDLREQALEEAWSLCERLPSTDDHIAREVLLERARRFAQSRETREQALQGFEQVIAMHRDAAQSVSPRVVIDLARCRLELFDERDQRAKGFQEMTEALALARQQHDVEAEAHAHRGLLRYHLYFDRYPDAKKHAAEGALLFEQLEDLDNKHYCQSNLITLEVLSGPLDRVESHARELLAELPRGHHRAATASLDIAEASYHVGDYLQALHGARSWKNHERLPLRGRALRLAGRCWAELGHHPRAFERFARIKDEVSRLGADLQGGKSWENLLNDLEIARVELRLAQSIKRFGVAAPSTMTTSDLVAMLNEGGERAAKHEQDVYGACLKSMLLEAQAMEGLEPDPREADETIERVRSTGAAIAIMEIHYHLANAFVAFDAVRALGFARDGVHTSGMARDVGFLWRLHGIAGDIYAGLGQPVAARASYSKALTLIRGCFNRLVRHKQRALAFMRDPYKRHIIGALGKGHADRADKTMAGARA